MMLGRDWRLFAWGMFGGLGGNAFWRGHLLASVCLFVVSTCFYLSAPRVRIVPELP
jgi:hypothetical protein